MTIHKKRPHIFLKHLFSFLAVAWCGVFLWVVFAYVNYSPSQELPVIGEYTSFKKGEMLHDEEHRFFVLADDRGIYALSDVCTHNGCIVIGKEFGFDCPCHQARYDKNGDIVQGPAVNSLEHYYITKSRDGKLIVDCSRSVPAEFRYTE